MTDRQCTCKRCGASFLPCEGSTGQYCSRSCSNRRASGVGSLPASLSAGVCERCGRDFVFRARDRSRFCSADCRGGVNIYGKRRRMSEKDYAANFWRRCQQTASGCMEWTATRFRRGYGKVAMFGSSKVTSAHRVAWELTNGPIPDGLWVLHKCDNRSCCRPDHLFLGTPLDNVQDMLRKGRGSHQARVG